MTLPKLSNASLETQFSSLATLQSDAKTYAAGTILNTEKEGFAYECVASGGDLTLDSGQQVLVLPGDNGYNVKAFGASSSKSETENAAIIRDVLNLHAQCVVPEDVSYDDTAIQADPGDMFFDLENRQIGFGVVALKGGSQGTHISLRGAKTDESAGLYIMPKGTAPGDQPGALKVFWEDYDTLLNEGGITASDYRDGGYTVNQNDGHNGLGSLQINSQSGGAYTPLAPDIHLGFRNNTIKPLRLLLPQIRALPAGAVFSGGLAAFAEGKGIWYPNTAYTAGDIIMQGGGRFYEATNTGTSGTSRPVHATYSLIELTVANTSGFVLEEYVDTGAGGSYPRGYIYSIPDSTTLRLYKPNSVALSPGFQVSDTITGGTSGASTTVSVVGSYNLDHDFDPNGAPIQQFNAVAVAGRESSDGGVTWRFLDDMTGGNSNNATPTPVVIFGDEDSIPRYYDSDARFQFINYFPVLREDANDNEWHVTLNDSGDVASTHSDGYTKTLYNSQKVEVWDDVGQAFVPKSKTSGDTTFDVTGCGFVKFNDTSSTPFTGFTGGRDGQVVHCRFQSNNTTLQDSSNLQVRSDFNTRGNLTPTAGTCVTFIRSSASVWTML